MPHGLRLLKCSPSYRGDFAEVSIGYCGEKGPRGSLRSVDPDVTLQNLPKDRASSTAAGPIRAVQKVRMVTVPGVQDLARLLYFSGRLPSLGFVLEYELGSLSIH